MSAITAKARRKIKKYAVLTREPRCFLGSFDFSWEQRKLGDVVKEITRNDPESEAPIMMITANNGFIEQSERYAFNNAGESLKKYILLKKGELAYNHGASKLRPYGSCFALTTAENARIPFVYHCFFAENQNAEFMSIELNGAEIENQLRKIVSSGARMDGLLNISFDEYTSVSVLLPGTEEQDRIADFFRHLDNLITLHQRKCVFLFSYFRACISMNFTASTFSWEQRKLGDIADIVGGGTPSTGNQSYWDGDIDWYAPAEIADQIYVNSSQKKITGLGYENSSAKMLPPGTVLFTSRAGIGKTAILTRKGCTNQGFQSIVPHRGELDSYFIFSRTEELKRYGELVGAGSTFVEVSGKQMAVMELMMPPTMREQQTIGGFFQQLDNLITLHQRECISFTGSAGRLILTANKKRTASSWEQRKFSDVVATRRGLTYKPSDIRKNGVRVLRSSNIAEDSFALSDEDVFVVREAVNIDCARANDILITAANGSSRLVGKHTIISGIPEESAVHGGFMLLGTTKEPHFVNASMGSSWYRRFIELFVAGGNGAIGNLNKNDLDNQEIAIPSEDEQKKIGAFFQHLDNLITLHQRKGKAAVTGCSNDANNSKGVYCKARDFGYKCYKEVKSQQIRCLIAVFIFCV